MDGSSQETLRHWVSRLARTVETVLVVVVLVPTVCVIIWEVLIEFRVVESKPGDGIVAASLLIIAGTAGYPAIGILVRVVAARIGPFMN